MSTPANSLFGTKKTIRCGGKLLDLRQPVVMGILNATPDSFYAGSRTPELSQLTDRAGEMLREGATILDLGGYSSRPGAEHIPEQQELDRVLPALEAVLKTNPEAIISVDTFRASVARQAVKAGASIINDISGGSLDDLLLQTVAELQLPYVLMHMRGTPQTMQQLAHYDNLMLELITYFEEKITHLRSLGITDIILDPGFGFAKTVAHNFEIMWQLEQLQVFGLPVLVGISRKSMVYKSLGNTPADALTGTIALHMAALGRGASFLRAHDV